MQNVIIYTRVSTDEQADKGFSLIHQKTILELYCKHKELTILKHFQEDYSAKNFDRPEYKKLLLYVKANKKNIDALLFTKFDRFSRNAEESYRQIREFKAIGIEVIAIEQPLDLSLPETKILLSILLTMGEVENDKISMRTIEGMRAASKLGCFLGAAPIGYFHHRNQDGKSTLKPNLEIASVINKAFKDYSLGIYSSEEIRKKYYHKGLKISKNTFLNLLKNPVYCGKILIKEYKKEDAMIVQGLHKAIVDTKTFEKVQLVFQGKQVKAVDEPKMIDEILPLRGFLQCPACGRTLTGSGSMGGGTKRHYYYHCNPPCRERYKFSDVHQILESLLKEFVINDNCKEVYKKVLDKTFKKEAGDRESELKSIKREINKFQVRLESIEEKFFDDQIDVKIYNASKRKTESQIANLKAEVESISVIEKDFEGHLKKGISFLQKVDTLYKNAPAPIKKKILSSLFPEKLLFETTHFKTPQIDAFIGYILLNNKKLKYLKVDNPIATNFNIKQSRVVLDLEMLE